MRANYFKLTFLESYYGKAREEESSRSVQSIREVHKLTSLNNATIINFTRPRYKMYKICHVVASIYFKSCDTCVSLCSLSSRDLPASIAYKLSSGYSEKQIRIDDAFHSHRIDEDIVIRTRREF